MPAGELPLVSLGLPVFNGAAHLAESLQSLLDQDYPHLEILISDNASTDGTGTICRAFAARDPRIRYFRQPANIGAKRNFEHLAEQARGRYFAWCAHDDVRKPRFASACVAALEGHPEAVLCNGIVEFLDERGAVRGDWEDLNFGTLGLGKAERMLRLVDHLDWVDMMGLMRLDALKQALPLATVWGGDVVLSMKLLAMGDFLKVPEVLFQYRVRTRPKGVATTMEEVLGAPTRVDQPYLDMLDALLVEALKALPLPAERRAFFRAFLRTLVGTDRQGPHPSWLEALAPEGGPPRLREHVPLLLVRRLLPRLGAEVEAEAYLDAEVRTVLLACPGDPESRALLPGLVQALAERHPGVRLLLLGPRPTLRRLPPMGEAERIQLPSPLRREALGPLIDALSHRQLDLAIHPGPRTQDALLDACITGTRAFRTFGFMAPPQRYRWSLEGLVPKRRRVPDLNRAYTHLLPMTPGRERAAALRRALGLD